MYFVFKLTIDIWFIRVEKAVHLRNSVGCFTYNILLSPFSVVPSRRLAMVAIRRQLYKILSCLGNNFSIFYIYRFLYKYFFNI